MASKQVSEILVKLGIQGSEGLDKLKSSFRELEKSIGPSNATIEKARRSIIEFGDASSRTEQVIRGQLEAFKGLRGQAEIGSSTYNKLTSSIAVLETELRGSSAAIDQQRESIVRATSASERNAQALQQQIRALTELQRQARPGSSAFAQLGKDIDNAKTKLSNLSNEAAQFNRTLNAGFGATPEVLGGQIATLRRGLSGLRFDSEKYLETLQRIRLLSVTQAGRTGRAEVIAGFQAFQSPIFQGGYADPSRLPGLPNTTAALEQQLSELAGELANVERGSARYVEVSNRMASIQRELRAELTGTAEAFRKLDIAQAGVERREGKLAGIQEYYGTQGPMAPGVGGYRDPVTGAMIAAGARTPGRIRVQEAAYPTPIGPQPFPEAGRRAQESIERAMDDVNRIYEDARLRRVEIQSKYDQIQIDKMLDGLELEGRVREKGFRDELAAFDRQLEARDRKRRGRLTAGQAVQAAGAVISGGIFGGPEGFLGGLGGFAAGLAIPGLGPVGGAFAGAAGGAQLGALRQAAGAAAEYAAEIRRLQLALQGVVYSFEDYKAALRAIELTSEQFNIPVLQSTQQFTKLSAAVIGSGGTIKDAENTFKGLTASVLATGGSIQDVNGALVAAAQVFSKGKVSAEELRGQIGERLAGAFALFAESSGKSTKELDADLQSGEVTLAQFVKFVEFSLKKYGRTAQIIADSPEQAGARLDRALKNLQKNIGNALGPSGAAFQDFAARSIRGIDRVINKLIELKAIQPGAGFYQEQVLGGQMSIQELETALLEAGSRETALRKSVLPGLGFMADFLPGVSEATKEVKILEEALVKLRLIEKETNKERKQRQDDEAKTEKEKLGQQYLQAVEQREEALLDARRQREEEIAKIRKNAIEQAAQIERQLGDERRQVERDIERTRREMEFGAGELDRLRRLAAGGDPEVIEAERKAAEINQRATEDRIKIEEDLLDKELTQQRTIADFQKNTAKQIAEANENYAKRVGEIQRDFSKASAKIIEEGSGAGAKRLTLAAQIVSQILQRTSLNQQRTQFGLQPVGEPSGFVRGRPVYSGLKADEVPQQIQRIDVNLEQLLRKLSQQTQGRQSALPVREFSISRLASNFESIASASIGSLGPLAQVIPSAAPTSQLRRQGAQQQIQQVNQNQLQEQFGALSEITQTSRDTYKTLQDQTREIELQIKYLSEGHEPTIARELTTLQQSYETQKRRLQVQAQALINQGQNADAVSEQYNLELQNLDILNKQNQQLAIQNEQRNKAIQDAQQLKDAVLNPLQQGFTQSFDLLINGTENWGNSLRQIAATVLRDIARQLIQIYVINQAISAISKLFPTPGGGTIPVAAVAANGMAFAKNGIQPFAMGGIVNKPTLFRYADGGAGRFGLMGEAGPEAIMPLKRGRDGKLGISGGGGTTNVVVNVDASGSSIQGNQPDANALGRVVGAAVQAELIKQKRPGGLLA